jgi:FlaA1/EpsC-like NDP-sugar epimerase
MRSDKVSKILNRKQFPILIEPHGITFSKKERILLTGADGSIGRALTARINLQSSYIDGLLTTDIVGDHEYLDVTDFQNVFSVVNKFKPTIIVNIAGAKHAPLGEREIWKTLSINTVGTKNIVDAAPSNCKVVLASTCKANNPEIVYGASKLIAEKIALNAGGSVARYFNVVETSGNVFEIWDHLPSDQSIKVVAECERHFISLEESVGLIMHTMTSSPGRYIVNSIERRNMLDIANSLYSQRDIIRIPPRKGDRICELFKSTSESIESYHLDSSVIKLISIHD